MRKQLIGITFFLLSCGIVGVTAQTSSMTDSQVIEYVKQGLQQGKDQQTIALELLSQGATQEQLLRLKSQYSSSTSAAESSSSSDEGASESELDTERTRKINEGKTAALTGSNASDKNPNDFLLSDEMKGTMERRAALKKATVSEDDVFGRNIFNIDKLTFEPNNNMATPANYCLGQGD